MIDHNKYEVSEFTAAKTELRQIVVEYSDVIDKSQIDKEKLKKLIAIIEENKGGSEEQRKYDSKLIEDARKILEGL